MDEFTSNCIQLTIAILLTFGFAVGFLDVGDFIAMGIGIAIGRIWDEIQNRKK